MAQRCFVRVFYYVVVIVASIQATRAVEYSVANRAISTRGGVVFRDQVGADYAKRTLESATRFVWSTFKQNSTAGRKNVQKVSLIVEDIGGVAFTSNNQIHLSASYVGNYSRNVKTEITGVLYHEVTHVWQWSGANIGWVIEGIADFVRLQARYAPDHWVKRGQGNTWTALYGGVTAYFLEYCEGLRSGFVAELNKKVMTGYKDDVFLKLLGKPVGQLWNDYKAKYAN